MLTPPSLSGYSSPYESFSQLHIGQMSKSLISANTYLPQTGHVCFCGFEAIDAK